MKKYISNLRREATTFACSISSPESAASASDSKERGCRQSHSARSTPFAGGSSPSTGQMSLVSMMSESSTATQSELWMSYAEAFRVRILAQQDRVSALTVNAREYG